MMTANPREYSLLDTLIQLVDHTVHIFSTSHTPALPMEGSTQSEALSKETVQTAIAMMRVDHSGEICAQALYWGQSLASRDPALKAHLLAAGEEEKAHLSWCYARLSALGGKASYLNPLWAFGAFSIGVTAGLLGDKWSLGFLAETEKQVTQHLETQLSCLHPEDHNTRLILEKMKEDEIQHATEAIKQGGVELPTPVKFLMAKSAKIMTWTAQYI